MSAPYKCSSCGIERATPFPMSEAGDIYCPDCNETHVTFKCLLCEKGEIRYQFIERPKDTEHGTHVWICEECPFVAFEFWQDHNAVDLLKVLNVKII